MILDYNVRLQCGLSGKDTGKEMVGERNKVINALSSPSKVGPLQ